MVGRTAAPGARAIALRLRLRFAAGLVGLLVGFLAACGPVRRPQAVTPLPPSSPRPLPAPATEAVGPLPSPTARPRLVLSEGDQSLGDLEAPVTMVAYLDFQCRYCAAVAIALRQVQGLHPDDVALVYRPFPQESQHDKSVLAARLADAGGLQGEFWGMFDLLYGRQSEWVDLPADAFLLWAAQHAADLGLDPVRLEQESKSQVVAERVERARSRAQEAGLPGAPILYLNGGLFQPPPTPANLEASVRLELLAQRQYSAFPSFEIDPSAEYRARLRFDEGEIVVRLFAEEAPLAVASFVFLAQEGWYDGSPVQRVVPGAFFETGDPSGTGLGGPGYSFPTETHPALQFDRPGRVALSSVGPDANGSQFFIALDALPGLDGTRTIFGQALEGIGLAADWEARDPLSDLMIPPPATLEAIILVTP